MPSRRSSRHDSSEEPGSESRGEGALPWPMILAVVTLFVMVGFQSIQLLRERSALRATHEGQITAYDESSKVRAQFESIANGTVKLAENGNQNAAAIVQVLKQAGVSFKGN